MNTILISGGSGFVGKYLCSKLIEKGYKVSILSRKNKQDTRITYYYWDISNNYIEKGAIEEADYIIHLAGENIGDKRWSKKRKRSIIDSRVKTAQLIYNKIKENNNKIEAFISASAVGYYGSVTSNEIFDESKPHTPDFLGNVCFKWEQASDCFKNLNIRTVKIRTGLVLAKNEGILKKMSLPIKWWVGSAIGTGKQFLPWIHIDDLCNIYIKAIEDIQMEGAYNAVAPEHITNTEFMRTLAKVLKKPFWFPKPPPFLLRLAFGEMSDILLKGSRISSKKIIAQGYIFRFISLKESLMDLYNKTL